MLTYLVSPVLPSVELLLAGELNRASGGKG